MAIGGSGGSRIFGAVFQVLLNLDWGLDVSAAIEAGRLHDQLYPLTLDADNTYDKDILRDLRRRGHNVTGCIFLLQICTADGWVDFFFAPQFWMSTVWHLWSRLLYNRILRYMVCLILKFCLFPWFMIVL